jgi:hypothetical protein
MAGFKQPVYDFGLQPTIFSVYDSSYELLKQSTTAPLPIAPRDYNYKLLDTIAINGRMSYMIYFKKKRK